MKQMTMVFSMLVLGFASLARAAEEPKFVSKTFQDIQSRVAVRDPECDAILEVKPKEDAPPHTGALSFSIEEKGGDDVIIILSVRWMTGDAVYERYLLRLDDALRQELKNQQRHKELEVIRAAKAVEHDKKQITEMSKGTLAYGMTMDEVVKAMGKPDSVSHWQAAQGSSALYPDVRLDFWSDRLTHMERRE